MWPAYFFISWIPIPLNAIQTLWEQHRGLLYLLQHLFHVSLTFAKLRHSLFTQRTPLQSVHKAFQLDPRFPHLEGTNRSFPLSFTSYDDSSLAVVLLGCVPQRDQIAAHRPQSANTRESIKQWRCHHSNGYWGQLVPCDHHATLCKGHPKSKLQTQFLAFERFETFIGKESLFRLYDNRHWVTPHTFTSVRNKCWPWHSVCTGSTQSDTQSKEKHRMIHWKTPWGYLCQYFPVWRSFFGEGTSFCWQTHHRLTNIPLPCRNLNHQKITPKQCQQRNQGLCWLQVSTGAVQHWTPENSDSALGYFLALV